MDQNLRKIPYVIILEGLDGTGKSSVAKSIQRQLSEIGMTSRYIHFPNYDSCTGKVIKEYLDGNIYDDPVTADWFASSLLYIIDRIYFNNSNILFTDDYDFLILDRSWLSNVFFQIPKIINNIDSKFNRRFAILEALGKLANSEFPHASFFNRIPEKNYFKVYLTHPDVKINMDIIDRRAKGHDKHDSNVSFLSMLKDCENDILKILHKNSNFLQMFNYGYYFKIDDIIKASKYTIPEETYTLRPIDDMARDIIDRAFAKFEYNNMNKNDE